ncbi:collagen-like protein [Sinomicrobium soli]|uniref:collagen-like protein n=1 Tax=Sinomicrobium sp. N-1-3-6 TaxID=2219864 RepID=UPI000DCF3DD0|nr:collagen-like protein [Sinomicrobium sp. N-1-3-6]RAV30386.1 collagen-like protein [Sinomicrobium sp. N-1-3-6]
MKRILAVLLALPLVFISCEGDQGPPGENGQDAFIGLTYDFFIDLNEQNNFSYTLPFGEEGIEVYESDAVLVYHSSEFYEDPEGDINVWKLLPQSVYFTNGDILEYNYDHTFEEVRIFLDGNIADLGTLDTGYTHDQLFRVVVAPSDFIAESKVDVSDYQAVVRELKSYNPDHQ